MKNQYKAVIFDLDGTLLDSIKDIAISMNAVLKANDLPEHPLEDYNHLVGSGAETLVKRSLPQDSTSDELIDECLLEFKDIYKRNWNIHSRVFDGIDELLKNLVNENISIAVFSNKPNDFVQLCVKKYLHGHSFTHVLGHNDDVSLKPDPTGALMIAKDLNLDPADIIFVGDTGIDMQTAINANMLPVGVTWGFRPIELQSHGAEFVLSHPSELMQLLQND